jgi:hypothetical protein
MHSAFNQFEAFTQAAIDNKAFAAKGTLTMPVLAIGADKSFGTVVADEPCFVATDVTSGVISNAGHWMMKTSRPRQSRSPAPPRQEIGDEINGSGQRRDLGYQASDFIH